MLKITPNSGRVTVGGTLQFNSDTPVTWSVAKGGTGNGSIDTNGLYKNSKAGSDTIIATPKDGSAGTSVSVTAS